MNAEAESVLFVQEGITAFQQNNFAAARSAFIKAIQIFPKSQLAWSWLGHMETDKDHKKECLEKAIKINPDNEIGLFSLRELKILSITELNPTSVKRTTPPPVALSPTQIQAKTHQQTDVVLLAETQPPPLPQTIAENWFYMLNNQRVGPVKDVDFPQLIACAKVNRNTMVWTQGFSEWIPLEQTKLISLFTAPPPSKVPWYFSRSALIFTFLFLTPIWSILILANRKRQSIGVRIIAVLVGIGYLWLFGAPFLGASSVTTVTGPSIIEFGTDYTEMSNSVSVSIPKSRFSLGDQVAWVAQLRGPVKTTRVDLVLSKVGVSGGEVVLDRSVINIADPNSTILYGRFPLLFTQDGNYKLRIIYNDKSLAEGAFKVSK